MLAGRRAWQQVVLQFLEACGKVREERTWFQGLKEGVFGSSMEGLFVFLTISSNGIFCKNLTQGILNFTFIFLHNIL